jgi:hypothetical protein
MKWKMGALRYIIRVERKESEFFAHPFPAVEGLKSFEEG